MTEEDCLKQVIAGNTGYYRYIVDKYKDMMYSVAIGILKNDILAEEAVQDAFILAYKGLKNFRGDARFSTWLYKITVNESLKQQKTKKKYSDQQDIEKMKHSDLQVLSNAVSAIREEEQKRFIQKTLDSMPTNEGLLLRLYYLNERNIDEINEITGLSVSNIKVILHRARKTFYDKLGSILQNELKSIL